MDIRETEAFDLLGNTVAVPVVEAISRRILKEVYLTNKKKTKEGDSTL
jgi:site-specific DNA-cytosine methylase